MKIWNVTVAPEFGEDIRSIHAYVSGTLLEPVVAKNLIDRILKAVGELSTFPLRNPVYEKEPWKSRGLRKMKVGNYLVFYLIDEKSNTVVVLHVFYAGRNLDECLSGDSTESE